MDNDLSLYLVVLAVTSSEMESFMTKSSLIPLQSFFSYSPSVDKTNLSNFRRLLLCNFTIPQSGTA